MNTNLQPLISVTFQSEEDHTFDLSMFGVIRREVQAARTYLEGIGATMAPRTDERRAFVEERVTPAEPRS